MGGGVRAGGPQVAGNTACEIYFTPHQMQSLLCAAFAIPWERRAIPVVVQVPRFVHARVNAPFVRSGGLPAGHYRHGFDELVRRQAPTCACGRPGRAAA